MIPGPDSVDGPRRPRSTSVGRSRRSRRGSLLVPAGPTSTALDVLDRVLGRGFVDDCRGYRSGPRSGLGEGWAYQPTSSRHVLLADTHSRAGLCPTLRGHPSIESGRVGSTRVDNAMLSRTNHRQVQASLVDNRRVGSSRARRQESSTSVDKIPAKLADSVRSGPSSRVESSRVGDTTLSRTNSRQY